MIMLNFPNGGGGVLFVSSRFLQRVPSLISFAHKMHLIVHVLYSLYRSWYLCYNSSVMLLLSLVYLIVTYYPVNGKS